MRNNISWLEPDLRQPKDRLTLLARVVGRLITTVDPARLDHVLFELLGSALRLDAFLSYDSTDDSGLQLVAYGGLPEADIEGVGRLAPGLALCADAAQRRVPVQITAIQTSTDRSAERRGGKECVSTCSTRWWRNQ